jgi:hypothetical protein
MNRDTTSSRTSAAAEVQRLLANQVVVDDLSITANHSMQTELEMLGTPGLNEVLPAHVFYVLQALVQHLLVQSTEAQQRESA